MGTTVNIGKMWETFMHHLGLYKDLRESSLEQIHNNQYGRANATSKSAIHHLDKAKFHLNKIKEISEHSLKEITFRYANHVYYYIAVDMEMEGLEILLAILIAERNTPIIEVSREIEILEIQDLIQFRG